VVRQRLGQHFLASAAWRERIARLVLGGLPDAAPSETPTAHQQGLWVEIGAGHGEMTTLLAKRVRRLVAVELDPVLLPQLRERTAALPTVTVAPGDILAIDLAQLTGGERFHVYGNLPYYITSPILHRLLAHSDKLENAFLVVQLEVAARIVAHPGSRDYAYLSAFCQFYSKPEILLRIPPGAFHPPPKVASALVALQIPGKRAQLGIRDDAAFLKLLKICFAQKRKTLRNNVRAIVPQEIAAEALHECGFASSVRAEELALEDFARLYAALKSLQEDA
jgi:16S rRNA (adenine1518-N6/adenine1519-N6)-dimethyltransferase